MSEQETATQATAPDSTGLTVRVESFVGPLDLLLHLCRTNEMDLARLSLRTITDQYLAHLESVRFQDLEMAGSFMVMAATLIYLKSKLLLPANPNDQEEALDEEGELLKREPARPAEPGEEEAGAITPGDTALAGDDSTDPMAAEAPRAATPAPPDDEPRTEPGEPPNA